MFTLWSSILASAKCTWQGWCELSDWKIVDAQRNLTPTVTELPGIMPCDTFMCFYKHPRSFNFSLPLICKEHLLSPRWGHDALSPEQPTLNVSPSFLSRSKSPVLQLCSFSATCHIVTQSTYFPLQVHEWSHWGHLLLRNHSLYCMSVCMLSHFSRVWLSVTLWTTAHQAPLSMRLSRQEYWSGLPRPSPGDLPDPGIKPAPLMSPTLSGRFLNHCATREAQIHSF